MPFSPIVLLIDDRQSMHREIGCMLAEQGDVDLHCCAERGEAFALAEHLGPTLIVMQGLESNLPLLQQFRQSDALAAVPVLMLADDEWLLQQAFKLGVTDCLLHMPEADELLARIQYHSRAYIDQLELASSQAILATEKRKLAELHRDMVRLGLLDVMTETTSKHYFDEAFSREWARAMRETESVSLLLIGVDYFSLYNRSYGEQAGDECLKIIASALTEELKRPTDFVARIGNDQFAVLLPGTHAPGAMKVAERMRQSVMALQLPHGGSDAHEHVTVTIGVTTAVPMLKHQPGEMLKAAKKAVSAAKSDGRNRIRCNGI